MGELIDYVLNYWHVSLGALAVVIFTTTYMIQHTRMKQQQEQTQQVEPDVSEEELFEQYLPQQRTTYVPGVGWVAEQPSNNSPVPDRETVGEPDTESVSVTDGPSATPTSEIPQVALMSDLQQTDPEIDGQQNNEPATQPEDQTPSLTEVVEQPDYGIERPFPPSDKQDLLTLASTDDTSRESEPASDQTLSTPLADHAELAAEKETELTAPLSDDIVPSTFPTDSETNEKEPENATQDDFLPPGINTGMKPEDENEATEAIAPADEDIPQPRKLPSRRSLRKRGIIQKALKTAPKLPKATTEAAEVERPAWEDLQSEKPLPTNTFPPATQIDDYEENNTLTENPSTPEATAEGELEDSTPAATPAIQAEELITPTLLNTEAEKDDASRDSDTVDNQSVNAEYQDDSTWRPTPQTNYWEPHPAPTDTYVNTSSTDPELGNLQSTPETLKHDDPGAAEPEETPPTEIPVEGWSSDYETTTQPGLGTELPTNDLDETTPTTIYNWCESYAQNHTSVEQLSAALNHARDPETGELTNQAHQDLDQAFHDELIPDDLYNSLLEAPTPNVGTFDEHTLPPPDSKEEKAAQRLAQLEAKEAARAEAQQKKEHQRAQKKQQKEQARAEKAAVRAQRRAEREAKKQARQKPDTSEFSAAAESIRQSHTRQDEPEPVAILPVSPLPEPDEPDLSEQQHDGPGYAIGASTRRTAGVDHVQYDLPEPLPATAAETT